MKIKVDVNPEIKETEITISCSELNEDIINLQKQLTKQSGNEIQLELHNENTSYFVRVSDILYFETCDGQIIAQGAIDAYDSDYRLYELEELLPYYFIRVSKSTIVNTKKIAAITRNVTASSLIRFKDSTKIAYVSRSYYHQLRDRLESEVIKEVKHE